MSGISKNHNMVTKTIDLYPFQQKLYTFILGYITEVAILLAL